MHLRTLTLGILVALVALAPSGAEAATLLGSRTLVVSEPTAENLYLLGTDVTVAASLQGDLLGVGGMVSILAPVQGDVLIVGGTVTVRKPVQSDVRIVGGEVVLDGDVGGDLMIAGGNVTASSSAKDTHIVGGNVRISGSGGRVTIYGADVYLSGTLRGDVTVVASDKIFVLEGTRIEGTLKYDAPQEVAVPANVVVTNGVVYTGSSAFLPTNEEAKRFAVVGSGVLFVTRIIAVVIAAGLLVGLFPVLAQMVVSRTLLYTPRRFVLLSLLGFATVIATPVLILFLLVSFVGILLAILVAGLYVILLLLAYLYAGLISGAALSRALFKKDSITWRVAVLGTLALYLVGSVPVIGGLVVAVITSSALGALIVIAYRQSFGASREDSSNVFDEDITH